MFAIHFHRETGAIRNWGNHDGSTESLAGPDYEIVLFDRWHAIDPLRQRIDVDRLTIVRRTRAEIAEALRLSVTNAIADELARTDMVMVDIADRPMPTEQRGRWRDYRQALRDLTGSVEDILAAWPLRPDGIDAAQRLRERLGD